MDCIFNWSGAKTYNISLRHSTKVLLYDVLYKNKIDLIVQTNIKKKSFDRAIQTISRILVSFFFHDHIFYKLEDVCQDVNSFVSNDVTCVMDEDVTFLKGSVIVLYNYTIFYPKALDEQVCKNKMNDNN